MLIQKTSETCTTEDKQVVTHGHQLATGIQLQVSSTTVPHELGQAGPITGISSRSNQVQHHKSLQIASYSTERCSAGHACRAGFSRNLSAMLRGMTRVDGYFHLLLAGALVGGLLFMNTAGESMWNNMNKGVRHICDICLWECMSKVVCSPAWQCADCYQCCVNMTQNVSCYLQKLFKDIPHRDKVPVTKVCRH